MANTALNVVITDGNTNETRNQTLTDLNPAASNAQLKAFAQAFYGLSDDNYVDATRVDKTDVDTEDSGKAFRNITVTGAIQGATATISANIQVGGSINPAVFFFANNTVTILTTTAATSDDPTIAKRSVTIPNNSGEMYIGLIANDDFYADFTFVGVE